MQPENIQLSYGESIKSNNLIRINLCTLLDLMTKNFEIKGRVNRIRNIDDHYLRQQTKRDIMPHFNFALFKNDIRKNENLESAQFLTYDFDSLTEQQYHFIYQDLLNDKNTFMLFHSVSGGCRLKLIQRLSDPVNNQNHFAENYKFYFNELRDKYNVEIDYSADVQKGSYLSFDEHLFINPDCENLPVIDYEEAEIIDIPEGGEYEDLSFLKEAAEFLKHKINGFAEYKRLGLSLASIGDKGREHFINICSDNPKYPNDKIEKLNKDFDYFLKSYDERKNNKIKINSFFYIALQKGFSFPARNFSYTEQGGADMLAYYFSHKIKYCCQQKAWYLWTGTKWKEDHTGEIRDYLKSLLKILYVKAANITDQAHKMELLKFIRTCEKRHVQDNILALAQSNEKIRILPDELDNKPYLFNCINGTIDLSSEEIIFREHDPKDLLTQSANVEINIDAMCPKWEAFLNTIFLNDSDVIEFIQKAFGYTLTGLTSEQCLFLMIGNGQNGKSTFVETLQYFMNDYSAKSDFNLVTPKKDGMVRNDIAKLKGPRFVVTSEPKEGIKFDESIIKDLTGGDTITARFLFKEEFSFKPMFKLWIYGNHRPIIKETSKGIYRRIRIIPFEYTFKEIEKRPQEEILSEFKEEASGILNWALEGFYKWKTEGFKAPVRVQAATDEYFEEMDFVQNFINECCVIAEDQKETVKEIYKYFQAYCKEQGEREITQKQLTAKLRNKGYDVYKGHKGYTFIKGLSVKLEAKADYNSNKDTGFLDRYSN